MCGIAGAIGIVTPALRAAVERANSCLAHRGPDGEGLWSGVPAGAAAPGAVLAHRRLAIIDLSAGAAQPMADPLTGNVIVYNGEIYNFQEIRSELERGGARFRTTSDTEVLLRAYAAWKEEALGRLRGMFAFVLWDAARGVALLARDRVGIKPLYWALARPPGESPALLFASEVRGLLGMELVPRKLSRAGLSTYLWNGFVVGPETIIDGIREFPAGSFAEVDPRAPRLEPRRYWELPRATPGSATVDEVAHELDTAARQHLISDVPLAVFLSGGVDSSAVTALAARAGQGLVKTFNVSFEEEAYDESKAARAIATAVGAEHHEILLRQETFRAQLPAALRSLDQPSFDAINTYFVSRAVREAGITVALAGTGGDELFGGYKSFEEVPRARRAGGALSFLPAPMLGAFAALLTRAKVGRFGEVPPQTRWGKLGDVLAARGNLLAVYQTFYAIYTRSFLEEIAAKEITETTMYGLPPERARELTARTNGAQAWHAVSMLELALFLGERLLRDSDCASMAVALELRVPLLDHRVIESLAGLEAAERFAPIRSKRLLKEIALRGVDRALFARPKMGFVLPIDVWARDRLREDVAAVFADRALVAGAGLDSSAIQKLWRAYQAGAPGLYWSRIWSLYALLTWCREQRARL
ncbi:MAG: asparagine synthase (glutamine-hydrolyzing) [Planctomycetes bacterium]|nr:asparagine synthase (glutamine-hydrolyzing) [Planctomycetota bacterium]